MGAVLAGCVEAQLKEINAEEGAWLMGLKTMFDQVHLLVVDPQLGIHRLVKAVKGRSSPLLRSEFPGLWSRLPSLWTNSYFVATVGGAPRSAFTRYVDDQKGR